MRVIQTDRRALLRGFAGGTGLLAAQGLLPAWAQSGSAGLRADLPTLEGPNVRLSVGHSPFTVGGRTGHAITVNGTLPAPLIRLREGQIFFLNNHLVAHGRSAFNDSPGGDRLVLRFWLRTHGGIDFEPDAA